MIDLSTLVVSHSGIIKSATEKSAFLKSIGIDFLQMTLYFLLAVYAVYYGPSIFNYLYFLVLLVLFWRSKKDYFWFGFYFILINSPAYMFFETSGAASRRLPLYSLAGGISFSVFDLFLLVSMAKAYVKGNFKKFYLNKPARFLLIYFLLVTLPITFIIGMEGTGFFNTFRPYLYYFLLVTFYFLVDDLEDVYKLGYIFIPYLFFTFFDQLFLLTQNKLLISIINPETVRYIVTNTVTGGARAYFSGFLLVLYAFIFALQLRMNPKFEVFNGFTYILIFVAYGTFLLSATRSYLMIPSMMLFMYLFFSRKGGSDIIKLSMMVFFFGVIFFSLGIIPFEFFAESIWPRFDAFFSTIFGGGNLAKFDTVESRLATDLPHILEGISNSPIVGTGFSGVFRNYENNDLGFLNTILLFGIVGFLVFLNFLIMLFYNLNKWTKSKFNNKNSKTVLNTVRMVFFGVLLGYATTYDFFTVREIDRIFFVCLILASAELSVAEIRKRKENAVKKFKTIKEAQS